MVSLTVSAVMTSQIGEVHTLHFPHCPRFQGPTLLARPPPQHRAGSFDLPLHSCDRLSNAMTGPRHPTQCDQALPALAASSPARSVARAATVAAHAGRACSLQAGQKDRMQRRRRRLRLRHPASVQHNGRRASCATAPPPAPVRAAARPQQRARTAACTPRRWGTPTGPSARSSAARRGGSRVHNVR